MGEIRSRLQGTLSSFFRILSVLLKDSSGSLHIRNASDTEHAEIQVLRVAVKELGANRRVTIQSPTLSSDITLVLPPSVGVSGDVVQSDGAGNLSFKPPVGDRLFLYNNYYNRNIGV